MNKIKFSHSYPKLWGQKKAELIAVRVLDAQAVQINTALIDYDTTYDDNGDLKHYYLPKEGKLIQLIFVGDKEIPFCTLRKHLVQKHEYYKKNIGTIFEIVIVQLD